MRAGHQLWFDPSISVVRVVPHPAGSALSRRGSIAQTIVPELKMTLRPKGRILITVRHRQQVEENLFRQ